MRPHHARLALALLAVLSACTAAQDASPEAKPVQAPATAEVADPMASFGRLVSGEWWTTFMNGTSSYGVWHWGPGRHSIHMGDVVDVYYWHPGRKQVCMFGLSPFREGVSEGTIRFDGETADAVFDLYQTGDLRKMGLRWDFDGPDKYREILLEATGPEGLKPMNAWDHIRSWTLTASRPPTAGEAPKPSQRLRAFASLLGRTWAAEGEWAGGEAFDVRTVIELVPDVDGIYASVLAPTQDGEPAHLLDAYVYHHTGAGALRCLALSESGGVYEGDVKVLEGGALQFDLNGYEAERVVPYVVRFDFEQAGALRSRFWSLSGTDRKLMLDVHFKQVAPKQE